MHRSCRPSRIVEVQLRGIRVAEPCHELLVVSPAPSARSAPRGHPAVTGPAARTARPARPRPEPGATQRYDWTTDPPGAATQPSPHQAPRRRRPGPPTRTTVNVRRRARWGTSGSGRSVSAPDTRPRSARSNLVTIVVMSGSLHTRLGSLIIRRRVAQPRLQRGASGLAEAAGFPLATAGAGSFTRRQRRR